MEKLLVQPDTASKTHEYCIDWSQDELSWSVDGKKGRTVKRSDSWNATAGRYDYPQTPSRVMLSLWPAGLPSNGEGTIEWAGGEIDWNSKFMTNGMYAALVTEVTVDCYDPPSGIKSVSNAKSYKYTDKNPTNNTVEMTNDYVVLHSLMDTGDEPGSASSSSKASSAAKPTKSVNMVPGGNPGGGARQDSAVAATNTAQPTSGTSFNGNLGGNTGSGDSGSSGSGSSGSGNDVWQQDDPNSPNNNGQSGNNNAGSALQPGLGKVGGSALAIVLAICGLVVL